MSRLALLESLTPEETALYIDVRELYETEGYSDMIYDRIRHIINQRPRVQLIQAFVLLFTRLRHNSKFMLQKYIFRNISSNELRNYIASYHSNVIGLTISTALEGLVRNPSFVSLEPGEYVLDAFYNARLPASSRTYVTNLLTKSKNMSFELAGCLLYHQAEEAKLRLSPADYSGVLRWARKQNANEWAVLPDAWLIELLKAKSLPNTQPIQPSIE